MMRSLYSGISGLRNHQTRMDVLGNNIANVNTAGYKTSRVIFQDIFSQNVASGMGNQGEMGGTNPIQVGLGIRLSTVDVIHTRAAFGRTDKETDMMINGDGFFILSTINPDTGEYEMLYTRAGNFDIDEGGYLVSSHGYYVMGYTQEMEMGVVDPGQRAYDAANAQTWNIADGGTQIIPHGTMIPIGTFQVGDVIPANLFGLGSPPGPDGTMVTLTAEMGPQPQSTMRTRIDFTFTNNRGAAMTINVPATGAQQARDPVFGLINSGRDNPETDANGLSRIRVKSDVMADMPRFEDLTDAQKLALAQMIQEGNPNLLPANFFDQFPAKTVSLPGFGVANNGDVSVILNNRSVVIGRIALAMFANDPGLEKAGNSLYRETASSGPVVITEAYNEGAGKIDSGGLEMSNVDLSNEFTDMIVTQRGFQANSRIITVSDTLLEELVNLKR